MSFDDITARINSATYRTFAKPAVVRVGSTDFVPPSGGIYSAPYTGGENVRRSRIGSMPVNRPDPHIEFRLDEYQATGAQDGDIVENHAGTFTIASAQPDSEGGTVDLTLRAY
jgi:hypothetical protein